MNAFFHAICNTKQYLIAHNLLNMYALLLLCLSLLCLLVLQEIIDRKEQTHFGKNEGDDKEQAPPFVYGDMLPVSGLNIDEGVSGLIIPMRWWWVVTPVDTLENTFFQIRGGQHSL